MRMVWKGTISFGLVTIPVRLYVATENRNVPSHQVHLSDGGRVQYKRVCSIDGAEVPYEEVGRGYESASGEMVVLSDVDLAMLPQSSSRSIDVVSFVPADAVDPIHLDRSYYVEPEPQAAKAYLLLREALEQSGRVAVAKVTLRDRELIAVLRVHGDVLLLATMLWPDEVRAPKFSFLADDGEWSAPKRELAMAQALIDSLSDEALDPNRYRDVHREALTALIDAKATGRPLIQESGAEAGPLDLLTALRASVEAAKQRKSTPADGRRRRTEQSSTSPKKPKKPVPTGRGSGPPKKRG